MADASTELPSLRALTARLCEVHSAFSHPIAGGEYVALRIQRRESGAPVSWGVIVLDAPSPWNFYGREWVPGDGVRFDAVAAARRLLAAARDAGFR